MTQNQTARSVAIARRGHDEAAHDNKQDGAPVIDLAGQGTHLDPEFILEKPNSPELNQQTHTTHAEVERSLPAIRLLPRFTEPKPRESRFVLVAEFAGHVVRKSDDELEAIVRRRDADPPARLELAFSKAHFHPEDWDGIREGAFLVYRTGWDQGPSVPRRPAAYVHVPQLPRMSQQAWDAATAHAEAAVAFLEQISK